MSQMKKIKTSNSPVGCTAFGGTGMIKNTIYVKHSYYCENITLIQSQNKYNDLTFWCFANISPVIPPAACRPSSITRWNQSITAGIRFTITPVSVVYGGLIQPMPYAWGQKEILYLFFVKFLFVPDKAFLYLDTIFFFYVNRNTILQHGRFSQMCLYNFIYHSVELRATAVLGNNF